MTDITKTWQTYSNNLLQFIKSRVNETDAEDILHEVFIKMHTRIDGLKEDSKIESWMYQITRNTIIDYYRTKKGTGELPEKYRTAVLLSEIDGKTQKEVAMMENISLSGAKSRVQRGRLLVKQMLEDCCKISTDKYNTPIEYHPKNCDCNGC